VDEGNDPGFVVEVQPADAGRLLVTLTGVVDYANLEDFRQRMLNDLGRDSKLTVDLSGVEFIDSSGLGVLVATFKQRQAVPDGFKVVGARPIVQRVLEASGLDVLFDSTPGPIDAAS
jgi:anti-anti-sigma factor